VSPSTSRLLLAALASAMAVVGAVSFLPILGGPDVLGEAQSLLFGLIFLGWAAVGQHEAGDDGERRNARILGGCAGVLIAIGTLDLIV
jgi:hypothetical protein